MTRLVKIPLDRVGALIGPEGAVKATLERRAHVRLNIDSQTGDVEIEETPKTQPLRVLQVEEVVRAIARGFSPENAYALFREDVYFAMLDIRDYSGHREARQRQIRGRVIGEKGRTRRMLEDLTACKIAVQGNTVAIIGEMGAIDNAKRGVDMLLSGAEHSTVYGFLERKRKQARFSMLDSVTIIPAEDLPPREEE
jgi:ribosomal RNA assembly protein